MFVCNQEIKQKTFEFVVYPTSTARDTKILGEKHWRMGLVSGTGTARETDQKLIPGGTFF
jgi:hypothetical protein